MKAIVVILMVFMALKCGSCAVDPPIPSGTSAEFVVYWRILSAGWAMMFLLIPALFGFEFKSKIINLGLVILTILAALSIFVGLFGAILS